MWRNYSMQKHTCQLECMDKNTFGERLRQERSRLSLTQEAFAAIGGVKKLAQINYEQGKTFPDAGYLIALSSVGVDIAYVMLGAPTADALAPDETELLAGYRLLDVRSKARVLGVMEGLVNPAAPGAPGTPGAAASQLTTSGPTIVFHGKVGQQLTGDVTGRQTFNVGTKKK